MIGSWNVQKALFSALRTAGVAEGRVYDARRDKPEFPYVLIGEVQLLSADVQCRDGSDEYRTLHIWSRYNGQKELLEIADQITGALHDQPIAVNGRDAALFRVSDLRTLDDPDGKTQHGVMTVRIQHFGPKEA